LDEHEFAALLKSKLSYKRVDCIKHTVYAIPYGFYDCMWVVDQGVIISERNSSEGSLIGTGIYSKDMIIGISGLNDINGIVMCRPLQNTVLLGYCPKDVLDLLSANVDAAISILHFACARFYFLLHSLELNSLHNIDERIDELENILNGLKQSVPDTVMAEYFGIHPASIGRARKSRMVKPRKHIYGS
jgi:hypothetical protein